MTSRSEIGKYREEKFLPGKQTRGKSKQRLSKTNPESYFLGA